MSADLLAAFLPVIATAGGFAVSRLAGRIAGLGAAVLHLGFQLATAPDRSRVFVSGELWMPLVALVAVAVAAEIAARRSAARTERAEKAKRETESQHAEATRLSRSLATVASGLQGSFEPDRRLYRFTTLVRTLLRADAAVTLVTTDGDRSFCIVEASSEGDPRLPESRDTVFPLEGVDGVAIRSLSFSAGESGLFGALMREHLSSTVGFAAPIRRGKQLAGVLLVGYKDATRELSETDRSLLAGSAALCATLFESVRLHQELRSSNQVKAEFISTVSHELRTPLNAIIGYCDLLRDGTMGEVNAEQRDALDRLLRHSIELAELIQGILEVDRLEGSYIAVEWTECDLDTFYRQLQKSIPAYWQKEDVELRWEGSATRKILTDAEKLRLSLRNVIHNALKFTTAGSVTVSMEVTPGTLMFTIRDTGVGMKPEVKESLFRMFLPGDRTNTRTRGGLGLGLYLADRMVKALWGQISIDSAPGDGTTVRIILPIEEPVTTGITDLLEEGRA